MINGLIEILESSDTVLDKVFVSYHDDDESEQYKNLLVAWSHNNSEEFQIHFSDYSIGTSINSENAPYIKSKIKKHIKQCNKFLCLIDSDTYTSDWVNWEIETAHDLGKRIAAIRIKNYYSAPINLYGISTKWVYSFNYQSIKDALD